MFFNNSCRLCLRNNKPMKNIITSKIKCADLELINCLYWIFGVEIEVNDCYSKLICKRCADVVEYVGDFREVFQKNQLILQGKLDELENICTNEFDGSENISDTSGDENNTDCATSCTEVLQDLSLPVVSIVRLEDSNIFAEYDKISRKLYKKRQCLNKGHFKKATRDVSTLTDPEDDDYVKVPAHILEDFFTPSVIIPKLDISTICEDRIDGIIFDGITRNRQNPKGTEDVTDPEITKYEQKEKSVVKKGTEDLVDVLDSKLLTIHSNIILNPANLTSELSKINLINHNCENSKGTDDLSCTLDGDWGEATDEYGDIDYSNSPETPEEIEGTTGSPDNGIKLLEVHTNVNLSSKETEDITDPLSTHYIRVSKALKDADIKQCELKQIEATNNSGKTLKETADLETDAVNDEYVKVPVDIFKNYCTPSLTITKLEDIPFRNVYKEVPAVTYKNIHGYLDCDVIWKDELRTKKLIDYYYSTPTTALQELIKGRSDVINRKKVMQPPNNKETSLVKIQEVFHVQVCKYCSMSFQNKTRLKIHYRKKHRYLNKQGTVNVIKHKKHQKKLYSTHNKSHTASKVKPDAEREKNLGCLTNTNDLNKSNELINPSRIEGEPSSNDTARNSFLNYSDHNYAIQTPLTEEVQEAAGDSANFENGSEQVDSNAEVEVTKRRVLRSARRRDKLEQIQTKNSPSSNNATNNSLQRILQDFTRRHYLSYSDLCKFQFTEKRKHIATNRVENTSLNATDLSTDKVEKTIKTTASDFKQPLSVQRLKDKCRAKLKQHMQLNQLSCKHQPEQKRRKNIYSTARKRNIGRKLPSLQQPNKNFENNITELSSLVGKININDKKATSNPLVVGNHNSSLNHGQIIDGNTTEQNKCDIENAAILSGEQVSKNGAVKVSRNDCTFSTKYRLEKTTVEQTHQSENTTDEDDHTPEAICEVQITSSQHGTGVDLNNSRDGQFELLQSEELNSDLLNEEPDSSDEQFELLQSEELNSDLLNEEPDSRDSAAEASTNESVIKYDEEVEIVEHIEQSESPNVGTGGMPETKCDALSEARQDLRSDPTDKEQCSIDFQAKSMEENSVLRFRKRCSKLSAIMNSINKIKKKQFGLVNNSHSFFSTEDDKRTNDNTVPSINSFNTASAVSNTDQQTSNVDIFNTSQIHNTTFGETTSDELRSRLFADQVLRLHTSAETKESVITISDSESDITERKREKLDPVTASLIEKRLAKIKNLQAQKERCQKIRLLLQTEIVKDAFRGKHYENT